jgi:hypothetical protein
MPEFYDLKAHWPPESVAQGAAMRARLGLPPA